MLRGLAASGCVQVLVGLVPPSFVDQEVDVELLLRILHHLAAGSGSQWVVEAYLEKTRELLADRLNALTEDRKAVLRALRRIPGCEEIGRQFARDED